MLRSVRNWNCVTSEIETQQNQDIMHSKIIVKKINFTRCMMKANESVQFENINLLLEIFNLKTTKRKLYNQKGPGSSDYIMLSIKLDLLINEYLEEKMEKQI